VLDRFPWRSALVLAVFSGLFITIITLTAGAARAPAPTNGDALDEYHENIKSWCLNELAKYGPLDDPEEAGFKALALYVSVSERPDKEAIKCYGMSRIYGECAQVAGLENRIVNGFALDIEAEDIPGGLLAFNKTHVWNQVRIDGEWRTIDTVQPEDQAAALFVGAPEFYPTWYYRPGSVISYEYPNGTIEQVNDGNLYLSKDWAQNFERYAWTDHSGRWLKYENGQITLA